jgi:regulatory subunit for Cdc7p protein kinase
MAAAVFIPPSPHDPLVRMATASRRAPLQSIPNVVNSPHRILTTSGSKRPRAQASIAQQENEHPSKRQATDKPTLEARPPTPTRHHQSNTAESRVFERGNGGSGSTALQKRLVAAREKGSGLRVTKRLETNEKTKENAVQQWQKHYSKIVPSFRFYFDNVADDVRSRFMRQIAYLGAVCGF